MPSHTTGNDIFTNHVLITVIICPCVNVKTLFVHRQYTGHLLAYHLTFAHLVAPRTAEFTIVGQNLPLKRRSPFHFTQGYRRFAKLNG